LQLLGKFYNNLVHFVVIGYISSRFGMLHLERSGNAGDNVRIVSNRRRTMSHKTISLFVSTDVQENKADLLRSSVPKKAGSCF
jgi:hypothetical protein